MLKCLNDKKGFTIIELVIVIGIISILSIIIIPSYHAGQNQFALQRSAHKLAQDLRKAQEMAMSSNEISGKNPTGYGIDFKKSRSNYYILFANLNSNTQRDGSDQDLETIELESKIIISDLSPSNNFSILFSPPDPITWVNNSSSKTAEITLSIQGTNETKIVRVNPAGLIEVE